MDAFHSLECRGPSPQCGFMSASSGELRGDFDPGRRGRNRGVPGKGWFPYTLIHDKII